MKHSIRAALATGGLGLFIAVVCTAIFRPDILGWDGRPRLCAGTVCFVVDVADTPDQLANGLMHRRSLGKKEGMLFIFDKPKQASFWMKNTLIPLDIVRLGSGWQVLHVVTAEPCLHDACPIYTYTGLASYALELNAGTIQKYDIHIGQTIQYQ